MELNLIIACMAVYIALVLFVPKVITKPTGIQVIDDVVLLLISQRGSLMSGTILIGIIVYLAQQAVARYDVVE